jgi:oligoribonuclease
MTRDPLNLVWLDLEMTGLEPDRHVIIEIASLVTDANLEVLAEGPVLAIRRTEEQLSLMDAWNRGTHGASGLLKRIAEDSVEIEEAERETLAFMRKWVQKGQSPLAGNSIAQDRRFLRREMPKVDAFLHYRNVDVSTIKELVRRWYPTVKPPEKKQAHQALDDIRESVVELRWYREHLFLPASAFPPPAPPEAPAAK